MANETTKSYKCKHCNLEFAALSEISKHMRASHPEVFKSKSKEPTKQCKYCGKLFTNNLGRRNHEKNTCPKRPSVLPMTHTPIIDTPLSPFHERIIDTPPPLGFSQTAKVLSDEEKQNLLNGINKIIDERLQGFTIPKSEPVTILPKLQKEVPSKMADNLSREDMDRVLELEKERTKMQMEGLKNSVESRLETIMRTLEGIQKPQPQAVSQPAPVLQPQVVQPQPVLPPSALESKIDQLTQAIAGLGKSPKEEDDTKSTQIINELRELRKSNQDLCDKFPDLCRRVERMERGIIDRPMRPMPISKINPDLGKEDKNNTLTKPCPDCGHILREPIIKHKDGLKGAYACNEPGATGETCRQKIMAQMGELIKENKDFEKEIKGLLKNPVQTGLKE